MSLPRHCDKTQLVLSIASGVPFKSWLFLWCPFGGMAPPDLLGCHGLLKVLTAICLLWNEEHLGLKNHCVKGERCFLLSSPYPYLLG